MGFPPEDPSLGLGMGVAEPGSPSLAVPYEGVSWERPGQGTQGTRHAWLLPGDP